MPAVALNMPLRWRLTRSEWSIPARGLLIWGAVFVTALASIRLTRASDGIAALWPADGIVIAALLRSRANTVWQRGPIYIGALIGFASANLASGDGLFLSTALPIANTAQVAATVWLLERFVGLPLDLERLRDLGLFVLVAGVISPLIGATIGASAISTAHWLPWLPTWLVWYPATSLATIIVVPFALTLDAEQCRALQVENRIPEAAAVLIAAALLTLLACWHGPEFLFLTVPVVLFATLRFGIAGAAASTLVVAALGHLLAIRGIDPSGLAHASLAERILVLKLSLATITVCSLPVAAVLAERDRLVTELSTAKAGTEATSRIKSKVLIGLRRRLSNAQEEERLRLARELHDQTGQSLVALKLELKRIENALDKRASPHLRRIGAQLDEIAETLNRVVWELRPTSIDGVGLAKALESHFTDWGIKFGIRTDFHCNQANIDELPNDVRTTIFRIVQEAVTNIAKHASGATTASIVVDQSSDTLQIIIEDNGCGFDPEAVAERSIRSQRGGLGLPGMRERLSLIDGELKIDSSVGVGTTLFVRIPLQMQGARP